jgi:hypothetical protein
MDDKTLLHAKDGSRQEEDEQQERNIRHRGTWDLRLNLRFSAETRHLELLNKSALALSYP